MGLTTASLLHVIAAFEWRDPEQSIFNRDTFSNGRFTLLTGIAIALAFVATTLPGLQRILDTADLGGPQWRVCLITAGIYLVLAEVGKAGLRFYNSRQAHAKPTPAKEVSV